MATSTTCADAPESALLLQSPGGSQATLTINGANISLGSTAYLTAKQNSEMEVSTIEGSAVVSAFNTTRIVQPGAKVGIALGGADGLPSSRLPTAYHGETPWLVEENDMARCMSGAVAHLQRHVADLHDIALPEPTRRLERRGRFGSRTARRGDFAARRDRQLAGGRPCLDAAQNDRPGASSTATTSCQRSSRV